MCDKKYYNKNKEKIKASNLKWAKENKEKTKKYKHKFKNKAKKIAREFVESKKDKCFQCYNTNKKCLEFHHKQDKKYLISKMVLSGYSIKLIEQEINKCLCICANCHRKIHFKGGKTKSLKYLYIQSIKNNSSCIKCGENSSCCLDFHHVNSNDKILNIGAMIRDKKYSIEDIKSEISKCVILCVNCHRQEH